MGFKRMVWENVKWIPLTQDKCQAVVKAVMKIRTSGNAGNFLTNSKSISFSKRIMLHK